MTRWHEHFDWQQANVDLLKCSPDDTGLQCTQSDIELLKYIYTYVAVNLQLCTCGKKLKALG